MTKGVCIFCKSAGKLTGEHMLPDWLNRRVPPVGEATHQYKRDDGQVTRPEWRGPAFETRVPVVCEGCNGGWMSALEDGDLIEPLVLGSRSVRLTNDKQGRVSAWVFLRAIMIQEHGGESAIPEEHYRELYETKRPPENCLIYLFAFLVGDAPQKDVVSFRSLTVPGMDTAYGLILTIGNLGALIVGHAELGVHAVGFHASFREAVVGVWPAKDHDVEWPPRLSLDAEGCEALAHALLITTSEEA
jgi:hypothetical protein